MPRQPVHPLRRLVPGLLAAILTMLRGSALDAQVTSRTPQAAGADPQSTPVVGKASAIAALQLVGAMNSADSGARARTIAHYLSAAVWPLRGAATERLFARIHEQSGGVEIARIEPAGRSTFVTLRSRRHPRLVLVNLGWDRADTTKLRVIEVLKAWHPGSDSLEWLGSARTEAELSARADRILGQLADMGEFSGSVLVAAGDRMLLEQAYGWANLDDSVRNAIDTRYATASIGKMFTAVAIGQLVEARKLRLADTLARVLPDYPNVERARQITIEQLLAHTAGLGDLWSHPEYVRDSAYASNRELAWAVADGPLRFPPGRGWSYSNEGYVVLGAIVERLSGQSFEDYVRAHVWEPAGMTESAFLGADAVVPRRAVGYRPRRDDPLRIEPLEPNWPLIGRTTGASGAGGAYATVTDLFRFSQALRHGRLLSAGMRDTLWAGRAVLPWDASTRYGYGFERTSVEGRVVVGHGGGGSGSGMDNRLQLFLDGQYTVVVLGNVDPPAAANVSKALVHALVKLGSGAADGTDGKAGREY